MKKKQWKHYAKTQKIIVRHLQQELRMLENAWHIDEHIQADGSLRPSLNERIKRAEWAEDNRDRFIKHLDTIASFLEIGWWDGDFPIDEVLNAITSYNTIK